MANQTASNSDVGRQDKPFDSIIVGAGHNGLATALVLARNGHQVLVLEKNDCAPNCRAVEETAVGWG